MRVLLLSTQLNGLGGVQYAGRLMLRALRDSVGPQGELAVVTVGDSDAQLRQVALDARVVGGRGSKLRSGRAAGRLLRRETWDVVVLAHLNLAALLLTVSANCLPPVVGFVHGLEAWRPLGVLRRRGAQRITRVLYNSRHTQRWSLVANPWLGRLPGELCPLGLLPEERERRSNGSSWDRPAGPFALAIGRMARSEGYKGFEEMIRAWPRVEKERGNFPLVLIGNGDDRSRLQSLAESVGANVRFLGAVSDGVRNACLQSCTCFCLPSRGEGLGLVYLEAMRAGKPVLAGSTDAGAEVVEDGQTGRTVDPANADELVQGLVDVSGERAEAMGQAGRERFETLFDYGRFLDRFGRHLNDVNGSRVACSA